MSEAQLKAKEIVVQMQYQEEPLNFEQAKKCALKCVNQIINYVPKKVITETEYIDNPIYLHLREVEQEINNL